VLVANSVVQVVGNTPVVRLQRLASHLKCNVYCKLEYLNPGGSVKDRVAFQIIEDAEAEGLLKPGGTVVEATSGNTGMGLALAAAVKGYKTVFVMPDKMSEEKIKALRAFGSKVVVTPTAVEPEDPRSYYSVSRRIAEETPGAFYANQYHNPSNPRAHYKTTGPEIWKQFEGKIDAFVSTMGTGGTISGVGQYLKEQDPNVQVVGVDPIGSILFDFFKTGEMTEAKTYKVEGFGEDFIPTTTDFSVVDDIVRVTDGECFDMCRRVVRQEGLYTGGSGGGCVAGALKWAAENDGEGKNIVVILPDSASRYLSKIFDDDWMREHGFMADTPYTGHVTDLLKVKERQEVITARMGQTVREAVGLMTAFGVSQLPVLDQDDKVVGLINESDVLNLMLSDGDVNRTIDEAVERGYGVAAPSDSLAELGPKFADSGVILILDEGRLTGILTKIDFIDYISRSM